MPSVTLRPASVISFGNARPWPNGSDAAANLRDGSDSTFAQVVQTGGYGGEYRFSLQNLSLHPLARITRVRVVTRFQVIGSPTNWSNYFHVLNLGGVEQTAGDNFVVQLPFNGNAGTHDFIGAWRTTAPDGSAWTVQKINQLQLILRDNNGGATEQVYEAYFDVEYDYRPSCSITAPAYDYRSNDNGKPTTQWQFSDSDGNTQSAYEVKYFTSPQSNPASSGAAAESGVVSSSSTSWTPPNPLNDGNYWVYVRVTDSTGLVSDWASSIFSVNTSPGITTVTAPSIGATLTATDKPTYRWTWSDPGGLTQDRWQVLVFESPQIDPLAAAASAKLSSGTQFSSATSWTPTVNLANGTYYVYIRGGNAPGGTERWSTWSSTVFTLQVAPPTTAFTSPTSNSTLSELNRPTFNWSFSSPLGYAQERWQILVFVSGQNDPSVAAANAVLNSGEQFTSAKTWTPTKGLSNGTYYAYLRVADVGSQGRYSSWASVVFTVNMLPGSIPVLRVDPTPIDFPATATVPSVDLHVLHAENGLDAPSANFETNIGYWTPGANCTVDRVVDAAFAKQGTAYLRATASAAGQIRATSGPGAGLVPITGDRYVTAAAWVRPNATARTVWLRIDWFNGSNSLGSTAGPLYQEEVGRWLQIEACGQAPATATHCSMHWIVEGAAISEQHFLDAAYVRVTPNKTAFDNVDDPNFVWPSNQFGAPTFGDDLLPSDVKSWWRIVNTVVGEPNPTFWHSGDPSIPAVTVPGSVEPLLLDLTGMPTHRASYSTARKVRRLYSGPALTVERGGVASKPVIDKSTASAVVNSATMTWSHDVTAGLLNSMVIVAVAWSGNAYQSHSVSSVTYGGVGMTAVTGALAQSNSSTPRNVQLYYLLNPAAGSSSVVVTMSSGSSVNYAAIATSMSNVNQTSPFGTASGTASASASSLSTNVTTDSTTDMVYAAVCVRNSPPSAGSSLSYIADYNANSGNTWVEVAQKSGTVGTNAASFSWTGGADNSALVAVPINGTATATAQLDVGFLATGDVDLAAIETFCGDEPGRLHTLYDQGLNALHLTETDSAHQFLLYDPDDGLSKAGSKNRLAAYAEDAARGMVSAAFGANFTGSKITAVAVAAIPSGGGGSSPGKTEGVVDDFSSQNTSLWNGYDGNPTVSGGQLRITPTSSYDSIKTVATYDFTGSFFSMEVVQRANQGSNSIECVMAVEKDASNYFSMLVSGTNLTLRERANSSNSDTTVTWNGTTMKFWRIRESSGTVYWETSPDGTTWTTRRSKTPAFSGITAMRPAIISGYWGTESSVGTFIVDSVNTGAAGTSPRVVSLIGASNTDSTGTEGAVLVGRQGTSAANAITRNGATRSTQALTFGTLAMLVGKVDETADSYTSGTDGTYTAGSTYNGGAFNATEITVCHTGSAYASVEGLKISEIHVFDDAPSTTVLNVIQSNVSAYYGTAVVPTSSGGGGSTGGGGGGTSSEVDTRFKLVRSWDGSYNPLSELVIYDWGKATSYKVNSWMKRNVTYDAVNKRIVMRAWKNGTYREGGAFYWRAPGTIGKSMAWECDYWTSNVVWMSPVYLTWYDGSGRWPLDGEIDIGEIFNGNSNQKTNTVKSFFHKDTVVGSTRALFAPSTATASSTLDKNAGHYRVNITTKHTIRCEWIHGVSIKVYVDGDLRATTTDLSYVPDTLAHRITMQQEFYGVSEDSVPAGSEAFTWISGMRAYAFTP